MTFRSVFFQVIGFVWCLCALFLCLRVIFDSTWLIDRSVVLCIIACYSGIGSLFLALANVVRKQD